MADHYQVVNASRLGRRGRKARKEDKEAEQAQAKAARGHSQAAPARAPRQPPEDVDADMPTAAGEVDGPSADQGVEGLSGDNSECSGGPAPGGGGVGDDAEGGDEDQAQQQLEEDLQANNSYEVARENEDGAMSTDNGGTDSDGECDANRDRVLVALLMAAHDDPNTAIRETCSRFQSIREYHNTSHAAAMGAWKWAWRFCDVLSIIKKDSARAEPVSYKSSHALAAKDLPAVKITTVHQNMLTCEYEDVVDVPIYPVLKYKDRQTWMLAYDITQCSLKAVIEHFRRDHPRMVTPLSLVLSLDGVPECNSSGRSIEVLSVMVDGCIRVYPLKIMRPNKQWSKKVPEPYTLDIHRKMGNILREVIELEALGIAKLRIVVADSPMRASIRQQKQHGAYWACDYCLQRAEYLRQTGMVFPYRSGGPAPPRTTELIRAKADLWDAIPSKERDKRDDDLQGVIGRSPLLDLVGYDIVGGVSGDAMHLVYLGVVKRTVNLTFKTGPGKYPGVVAKRLDINPLSYLLLQTRVPSEFPRRTREFDKHWKASEFRGLLVGMFPMLISCIDVDRPQRTIWLLMAFLVRACIVSDAEYAALRPEDLAIWHRTLYRRYQSAFGEYNCTYNFHVMSHLQEMRRQGRLQNASAFPFEASYAIIKNSYHPGTTSHGKQAIQRVMAKYCGADHRCERPLHLEAHRTSKKDDSIVYIAGNRFFRLHHAGSPDNPDLLKGRAIPTCIYSPAPYHLPWSKVGVYTVSGPPAGLEVTMSRKDVLGKGIVVPIGTMDAILTLPTDFLQEAT
jgi:hypothetical protein